MKKIFFYASLIFLTIVSFFFDKDISLKIAENRTPFLNGFFAWIASIFTTIIIMLVITTIFLLQEKKKTWVPSLWGSFFLTGIVCLILKFIIGRTRPFLELGLEKLSHVDYSFSRFNTSFPSFHAAVVFAVLPLLFKEFPKVKWFWLIFAILISFSRIYIGVHYLSDVLGGVVIGYFIGTQLSKKPLKKLIKSIKFLRK